LRAYVGVEQAEVRSPDGGATFVAEITIKNAGQTPALRVANWIDVCLGKVDGEPLNFPMPPKSVGELPMVPGRAFVLRRPIEVEAPALVR
jgi:hypothetical protein